MTEAEIIYVCNMYDDAIKEDGYLVVENGQPYEHIRWMLSKTKIHATENIEKAFRWLGFIQGFFWTTGDYSIGEMRSHNNVGDRPCKYSNECKILVLSGCAHLKCEDFVPTKNIKRMNNEINIGDTVLYTDRERKYNGKNLISIDVVKYGVWDGEKVILNDNEKTTIRNKDWLTVTKDYKYQSTEFLLDELVGLGSTNDCSKKEEEYTQQQIEKINEIILSRIKI